MSAEKDPRTPTRGFFVSTDLLAAPRGAQDAAKQEVVPDVLLICSDPVSIDHLSALASASQFTAEVAAAAQTSVTAWRRASLVVVGVEEVLGIVGTGWPRRSNVVIFGNPDPEHWQAALDLGVTAVVRPPGQPGWLADLVASSLPVADSGTVVGVLGCRGGAGASVFVCALGMAAVRAGHTPYLLDLDPCSCGLPVVLGDDSATGLTWDQVSAGTGRIPASSLQDTIGRVEGAGLLSFAEDQICDVDAAVVLAVMEAARACTPITVVDLARADTAAQREALSRCDRVFMLVPADVRSVRSAQRAITRIPHCEVVVRGPNPGGLVVSDIAAALDTPVIAAIAAERGLDARLERGEPPGWRARTALGRAGTGILREVLG